MRSFFGGYALSLLQRPPYWLRMLLSATRALMPWRRIGNNVIVLNAAATKEVLQRTQEFESGEVYRQKMLQGEFLFSLDPSWPRYAEFRSELGEVLAELRCEHDAVVDQAADAAVGRLTGRRQIDLITDLAEPVLAAIIEHFYGIEAPPNRSTVVAAEDPRRRLALLIRRVGSAIVYSTPAPFGHQLVAERASHELAQLLDNQIAARRSAQSAGEPARATVLDALIARELRAAGSFRADMVRAKLAGLLFAASPALTKAFAHAMHQLLSKAMGGSGPEPLLCAIAAASEGTDKGNCMVMSIVFEALRFNPTFPAVSRHCPRSTTLAATSNHALEVPAGANVTALLGTAMFDRLAFPNPDDFMYQRPAENYLHFGYGDHQCLGKTLATNALCALSLRTLKLNGIAQARVKKIRYDGVIVDSLPVELQPEPNA